jgi:hypothetical protein
VVLAYTANTPGLGQWESVELDYDVDSGQWTGQLPLPPEDAPPTLFIVQAVDQGGNVTADDNGGWYYTVAAFSSRPYSLYLPLVMRDD